MKASLELIRNVLNNVDDTQIEHIREEKHNQEYEAIRFTINNHTYRSRLAKLTPKKQGYFVVFWEKDSKGKNQPYLYDNSPDKIIISIIDNERKGQFIFPKKVLLEKGILKNTNTKGKMAIRVYPSWETNLNKTAQSTQKWQHQYFFEICNDIDIEKVKELYF